MTNTTTTSTLPLRAGTWTLDPLHAEVGFTVRHLGISKVRGAFRTFDVQVAVGDTLESSSVTATIDIASIDTGNADRDAHVLSPDLLDVATRPTMAFRSTRITADGEEGFRVDGELTIGEVTQPVTLEAELGGLESFPVDGSLHAGFEARTEIKRHDFGIHFGAMDAGLGNVIKIAIDLQLVAPATAPAA